MIDNPEKRDLDKLKRTIDKALGEPAMAGGDYIGKLVRIINDRDGLTRKVQQAEELLKERRIGEDERMADLAGEEFREWFTPEDVETLIKMFLLRGGGDGLDWDEANAQAEDVGYDETVTTVGDCDARFAEVAELAVADYQTGFSWELAGVWKVSALAVLSERQRCTKLGYALAYVETHWKDQGGEK